MKLHVILEMSGKNYHLLKSQASKLFGTVPVDKRPQVLNDDILRLRRQSLYTSDTANHPNREAVLQWTLSQAMLEVTETFKIPKKKPPIFVDTVDAFNAMATVLSQSKAIAVDVEANCDASYGALISLVQLSTLTDDFLVDPFAIPRIMRNELKNILTDTSHLIIMHGGSNDVAWLKTELGIYPVAVFDTQIYYRLKHGGQGISYDKLRCAYRMQPDDSKIKQLCQLADWRLRPLPTKMCEYAQEDSHFLIRIWNAIVMERNLTLMNQTVNEGKLMLLKSVTCTKIGGNSAQDFQKIKNPPFVTRESWELFDCIWLFRDYLSVLQDMHPWKMIPTAQVLEIATAQPKNPRELDFILSRAGAHGGHCLSLQGQNTILKIIAGGRPVLCHLRVLTCHICFTTGHPAWACVRKGTYEDMKRYFSLPGKEKEKNRQNHRRSVNKRKNKRPEPAPIDTSFAMKMVVYKNTETN